MDALYRAAKGGGTTATVSPSLISDIGSRLEQIIIRETGQHIACDACRNEIQRLNGLSASDVLAQQDSIVQGIVVRGRDVLGWWNPKRWAITLAPGQVADRVRTWVREAVESSRSASANGSGVPATQISTPMSRETRELASGQRQGVTRRQVLETRRNLAQQGHTLPPLNPQRQANVLRPGEKKPASSSTAAHTRGPNWAGAFTRTCIFLGEKLATVGCGCSANLKVPVYRCNHESGPERCLLTDRDFGLLPVIDRDNSTGSCQSCLTRVDLPRFITTQQYMLDVRRLSAMVPKDVSRIVGVSRSGLCAATMISMLHHLPLDIVRQHQGDLIPGGHGWRLQQRNQRSEGSVLVVDDTCMTGNSLRAVETLVRQHYGSQKVMFATVYANPLAVQKPDLWAVDLPWPHLLEWNLFNSVLLPACAMDFDGILCHDCPPADDDDGPRYLKFLEETMPLYPVRRQAIPLVVTARLEKYREATCTWLAAWGIEVRNLVMGPWSGLAERRRSDIAAFKAEHYAEFLKQRVRPGPHLFIESDVQQARRIAELSGGVVVCPAAGRCF
jgi:adenine/guanine phosphoribosyltransferase-like PRPP-binding protein